ncbi:LysM peptidoglycan-binding domain-containing protein [Ureibacillus sp. Re31]|uniref:LysM peptidoglycan-binding domain-containing protein n=1 Tax=Ureibacillus galli TaxID=2762222 RepID=A0ABR8XAX8_9BACL|nr:C40 family peptidase [Ureibacillus galli]MBD8026477.1 LysM peptidoglycan-binding domain-containing protein [Ureibacillus galli]
MKKSLVLSTVLIGSLIGGNSVFAANSHTVKSGDTLSQIAVQNSITVNEIMSLNNLRSSLIFPGQVLKLSNETTAKSKSNATSSTTYTIQKGDSLYKIAKTYKVTVNDLLKWNPSIKNESFISIGQKLVINGSKGTVSTTSPSKPASTTPNANSTYIVKQGDSLSKIAATHGISLSKLLSYNPQIAKASYIYVGQKINLVGSSATTSNNAKEDSTASVNGNEIVTSAKKYLGASYLYGASVNRTDAFDCSSFTYRIFKDAGNLTLPRTSSAQATVGKTVAISSVQPGDLVFFDTDFNGVINHVGVYVGNGQMISAATSSGVSYGNITSGYWKERIVKATRVL